MGLDRVCFECDSFLFTSDGCYYSLISYGKNMARPQETHASCTLPRRSQAVLSYSRKNNLGVTERTPPYSARIRIFALPVLLLCLLKCFIFDLTAARSAAGRTRLAVIYGLDIKSADEDVYYILTVDVL